LEFRIGSVLARTWVLFSRRALTFLMLKGGVGLVTVLSTVLLQGGWRALVDMTFSFTLHGIAQAIVILATFQEMRGDGVGPSAAVSYAVGRMLPLLALSWIYILGILIGLVLCIAPGLFFITITAVAFPACVVERLGPIKSITRSVRLTAGHRWPILAVFGTWWAIEIGASMITFRGLPKDQVPPRELVIWLWSTPLSTYLSVLTAVVYHDLRVEKEGIGVQEIAAIFD
jgi:uncharacterized membrane protein